MDTSFQQLNESLPQQRHKSLILAQPIDPSILSNESIQQQQQQQPEFLEGWKMSNQQRVSSETWKTSQQQIFRQPKPLPTVPLQQRHSMPPGDIYYNSLYYDQHQQQYHYSYQPPSMYSTIEPYYESTPNLVHEPYYTTYDQRHQQQIYPHQYQQDDYFQYTTSPYIQQQTNISSTHLVYEEPPSLLPTPSLAPSSSTTTTNTNTTPIATPTSITSLTNDKSTSSSPSLSSSSLPNTTPNNNNNNNNNIPKKKKNISSKSSFSPLDSRENIRQITVKSVNKEYRVWIDILPTETGLSLANKIHRIATFGTRKITKITTSQGRVIPLDARPIFGNWMDMTTFKNGEFWQVEWCELDKSMMDKFISKWLQVGNYSSSTKKSSSS